MHKLSDLKRGDKLITQNPETYEYALHKVSGTTGSNAVILDGGSYLLQQSNAGDSLYAMRRIATTYRAGNDPQGGNTIQPADIIHLFPAERATQAAEDCLNTLVMLQKGFMPHAYTQGTYSPVGKRTYPNDTESMAIARLKPHTLTPEVANALEVTLTKETTEATDDYLHNVAALQRSMTDLFEEDQYKLSTYRDAVASNATTCGNAVHILRNRYDGGDTQFGFVTGSLVTFKLANHPNLRTLQVAYGAEDNVYLAGKNGNIAGKFTTTSEHTAHETDDAYPNHPKSGYTNAELCYNCTNPEWRFTRLTYTPVNGEATRVTAYTVSLNTTFELEQERRELHAWQVQSLKALAKRYKHLTRGNPEPHFLPLYQAALELYRYDTNRLTVIEDVNKGVSRILQGAEDKAHIALGKLIFETQEAASRYLSLKNSAPTI
jgi:hypothetical protein